MLFASGILLNAQETLDLSRGGAINYISKSGSTRNIVNIHDEGSYIQQSYDEQSSRNLVRIY